jgi:hypothetical protein
MVEIWAIGEFGIRRKRTVKRLINQWKRGDDPAGKKLDPEYEFSLTSDSFPGAMLNKL